MYKLYADEAGDLHLRIIVGKDRNLWITEETAYYPMGCMMFYLRDNPDAWKRWDNDCFQAKHDHEDIFWSDEDMENLFSDLTEIADQDDMVTLFYYGYNDVILSHLRTAGYFRGPKPSKELVNLIARHHADPSAEDDNLLCKMAGETVVTEAMRRLQIVEW